MRSFIFVSAATFALCACGGSSDSDLFTDGGTTPDTSTGDSSGDTSTDDTGTDSGGDVAVDTGPTCQGLECQVVKCDSGTTTLSGVVYDPAGLRPIPNVAVYVPNGATAAIADGLTCSACQAPITGKPLSVVTTNAKGQFVIKDAPVGANIPLVMQLGKWRRAVTVPSVSACVDNALTDKNLTRLPKNKAEGNLPLIALESNGFDQIECFLVNQIGLDPAELSASTGTGRVHVYKGISPSTGLPTGATDAYAFWGNLATMKNYDLLFNACEAQVPARDSIGAAYTNMKSYLEAGGRLIGEHYQYNWFGSTGQCGGTCKGPADFNGVAAWGATAQTTPPETVDVSHPRGQVFSDWLVAVGASTTAGQLPLNDVRNDVGGVTAPTTRWIYGGPVNATTTYTLSFNTPIGSGSQCGRAVFADYHAGGAYTNPNAAWPTSCNGQPTTDHKNSALAMEYTFFDSFSCVQDDTKPTIVPPTQ
jgi:hypothetical protein